MGQYLFRLPDIGEGVAEAEITAWHVKPGDHIQEDAPLLDVMTDKATVDMTSPVEGTITALHGDVGSMAPVGSVLVEMEVEGEKSTMPPPRSPLRPRKSPPPPRKKKWRAMPAAAKRPARSIRSSIPIPPRRPPRAVAPWNGASSWKMCGAPARAAAS